MSTNRCILVVEDNDDDYEFMHRSFKKNNIKNPLVRCKDGQEALDYLFSQNKEECFEPAIILLDLNMPKVDGWEVLKEIRESEDIKHIPVIILTTSDDERDIQKGYRNGANSYIIKPVSVTSYIESFKHIKNYWLDLVTYPKE